MTEPTRDALHAETLAWVEREADVAERQSRNKRYSERARLIAEKQMERAAHAAACVRFVAALDAGEILSVMSVDYHSPGVPRQQWTVIMRDMVGAHGDTALQAFRAAQDHLKGGSDDGQ